MIAGGDGREEICRCCGISARTTPRFCELCEYLFGRQLPPTHSQTNDCKIPGLDEKIASCLEAVKRRRQSEVEYPEAVFSSLCDVLERDYFPLDEIYEVPPETRRKFHRYRDWGAELLLEEPLDLGPMGILERAPGHENVFLLHFGDNQNCLPLFMGTSRLGKILQCAGLERGWTRYPLHALLPTIGVFGCNSGTRQDGLNETPWCVLTQRTMGRGTLSENVPISMLPIFDLSLIELYCFPAMRYWNEVFDRGWLNYFLEVKRPDGWMLGLSDGLLVNEGDDWEFKNLSIVHQTRSYQQFGLTFDWGDMRSIFLLSAAALCPPSSEPSRLVKGVIEACRTEEIEEAIRPGAAIRNSIRLLHPIMKETGSIVTESPTQGILLRRSHSGASYLVSQGEFYWRISVKGISNRSIRGREPREIPIEEWIDVCVSVDDDTFPIGDNIATLLMGLRNDIDVASEIDCLAKLIEQ